MLLKYFIILFVYALAFAAARNLWNPHVEQNRSTKNHCEFENILKGWRDAFEFWGGEKIFCCYCQCSFWGQYFSHLNGRTNGGRRESAGFFFCVLENTHKFYANHVLLCDSLLLSFTLTRTHSFAISLVLIIFFLLLCVFCLLLFVSLYPWNMTMQISFGNSEISFLFRSLLSAVLAYNGDPTSERFHSFLAGSSTLHRHVFVLVVFVAFSRWIARGKKGKKGIRCRWPRTRPTRWASGLRTKKFSSLIVYDFIWKWGRKDERRPRTAQRRRGKERIDPCETFPATACGFRLS